jgi:succinate-acetate transporter protein
MVDSMTATEQTKRLRHADRVAAPWILGLYSLAGVTFIVATRWAGWYGGSGAESQYLLLPFVAVLGGITQLLAGMWAFVASDALATAVLGTWGSFWIGYGLLQALFVTGELVAPTAPFSELGFWFIVLAAITWMSAVAAMAENVALVGTLAFLAAGSTIAAIANLAGYSGLMLVAGWLFFIGSLFGWYTATAMLFEAMFHRSVLPLGLETAAESSSPQGPRRGEPVSVLSQTSAARHS